MKKSHLPSPHRRIVYFGCIFLLTVSTQVASAGVSFSYGLPGIAVGYGHHGGFYGGHRHYNSRGYYPRQRHQYFNHHNNAYRQYRYYNPRRFHRPQRRHNPRRSFRYYRY